MRCCDVTRLAARLAAAVMLGMGVPAQAQVLIGMSTPLTGAGAAYGRGLVEGVRLGLKPMLAGAADGPVAELQVLDDAGDPARAEANTRLLLQRGAAALTGYLGARSVEASLPQAQAAGVPMVGAASSADSLRDPQHRHLFNLRAGAADEIAAIVQHFDTIGAQRFAALAQDDALGAAGLQGLRHELTRIAIRPEALVTLGPGLDGGELARGVTHVCKTEPQALLLAIDAGWVLRAMSLARGSGCARTSFAVLSETGVALIGETAAAGVVVSQVLPHPMRLAHPLVAAYHRALAGESLRPSYASLEGFLYGRVLAEALRLCGRRAVAACIQDVLSSRTPEVPGWRLAFTPQDRRGARFIEITMLDREGRPLR